jgi:hypothetical protein
MRGRWIQLVLLQGTAQVLVAILCAFIIVFGLDSMFELSEQIRTAMLVATVLALAVALVLKVVRPLTRIPNSAQLARFLEEHHSELDDRLVTAIALGGREGSAASEEILNRLLEDTRLRTDAIDPAASISSARPLIWGTLGLILAIAAGSFVVSHRDFFSLLTSRFMTPWQFPNIEPQPVLVVRPGDARLPRGSAQEILAEVNDFEPTEVALYYSTDDSAWSKMDMDATQDANIFVYSFFDINTSLKYYVKAGNELSPIYRFTLYDPPQITRVDVRYDYPKYTGLASRTERDAGDVWAPEGTTVTITAVADKPLKSARVVVGEDTTLETEVRSDSMVVASLEVELDTFYRIYITDIDDLSNISPPEYYVHALFDQAPVLTIERPQADMKVSMIEEVPVEIRVEDDYGKPEVQLFYTINGGEEHEVDLALESVVPDKNLDAITQKVFRADHLFYFEDFSVTPGDFLSFFLKSRDRSRGNATPWQTSEIYFVHVRPFEMEFYRPLSQEQSGGGGGDMGGRLSETQQEILIATWKLQQKEAASGELPVKEDVDVIAESEQNLMEVVQSTLFQMEQRSMFTRESDGDAGVYYRAAIDAMSEAVEFLVAEDLEGALTPQRIALQNLLKAEAQVREMQMQQAQAQGGGRDASMNELSQLFEQEMDKLKSKYETMRESNQQQGQEQVDEALERVKELARRQQEQNDRLRELARKDILAEEKRRQIEELRRRQEELRREAQELTRQMRETLQNNPTLPRDAQQELRRASNEMTGSSNDLRQENAEMAAAKGRRALDRLKELQEMLQQNQDASLRKEMDELDEQFRNLTQEQKGLTEELQEMAKEDSADGQRLESARQTQEKLTRDMQQAMDELDQLAESSRRSQNEIARDMKELSEELRRSGIGERMEQAERHIEKQQLDAALQAEKDIQNRLEKTGDQLVKLRSQLAESEEEKLSVALDQTRRLREEIEALQAKSNEQKDNQQGGSSGDRGQMEPKDFQRLSEELSKRLDDLEFIERTIQVDSSLSRRAGQLGERWRGVVRNYNGQGEKDRFHIIEQYVLDPLKRFEAELAQKLELTRNTEKLFLVRDERVPPVYKELVDKYYESLSKAESN